MQVNILITSAGRRVSLLKAFQKELRSRFPGGEVFAVDYNPDLAPACHVAHKSFRVPKLSDPTYADRLLELCIKYQVKLVIPTIDTELIILAGKADEFRSHGIQIIISSLEFVRTCRNKRSVHAFFESREIKVAREYSKQDYEIPLFIKPLEGSGSSNTRAILSADQLLEEQVLDSNLMFLEYYDKKEYDEFTSDLYYDKQGILRCVVPRKRIEVREGEVSKAVTKRNILIDFIKDHLGHVDGARGCITLQLFKEKDGDDVIGIEINPRFGGGYPLSYLAGANYPAWIIQEYLKHDTIEDRFDCWEEDLLLLRYDNEILSRGYKG
ncbi:MAG: ATP-grasp domain-containing protein [Bacteroidia bacterium]|nr:ATP-grasp domain-containing protein [Bacteroidia bacterium]MBT8270160.1 ATP-grasp domain-containing protein [Bacteroidia bacterium]NNF82966.1 ATP-grasp domain-containing protein [Flavobacteriaceae bacterium]NNK68866.1 ATP-grasp domain-containing protein [Flavobacteriaceae bacterium]NNL79623.1 ATP-grasp domain-containing protein [Flavobacteriaceae bacterium]